MKNKEEFRRELESLINKHSMENESNTPDYILAEYLMDCLRVFNFSVNRRESWYGRDISPITDDPPGPLTIGKEVGLAVEKCEAPNCYCDNTTGCLKNTKI